MKKSNKSYDESIETVHSGSELKNLSLSTTSSVCSLGGQKATSSAGLTARLTKTHAKKSRFQTPLGIMITFCFVERNYPVNVHGKL